jgi:hypothetical protein
MPHCDTCNRFYNPNTLNADGTCPTCGRRVGDPSEAAAEETGAPWHFKALIGLTVVYLGWRLVQGLEWVAHHL